MIAGMKIRNLFLLLIAALPTLAPAQDLTLEQIMANPDWLGNQPENAFWGADNHTVFFEQKRQGSKLKDLYAVDSNDGAIAEVAEADWSRLFRANAIYNHTGDLHTWAYAGDIYVGKSD